MKQCNYCHVFKSITEFPLKKDGSYSGNCLICKNNRKQKRLDKSEEISIAKKKYYQCNKEKILGSRKEYYKKNKNIILIRNNKNYTKHREEYLEYKKKYYKENKEHILQCQKKDRQNNPEKFLLKAALKRAKEKKLPFNISLEDIIIPEICPVFSILLKTGNIEDRDDSPSLDRIIPELGYVKGNVRVISFKANTLKRDGHIEDFEKIIKYIKECKCIK